MKITCPRQIDACTGLKVPAGEVKLSWETASQLRLEKVETGVTASSQTGWLTDKEVNCSGKRTWNLSPSRGGEGLARARPFCSPKDWKKREGLKRILFFFLFLILEYIACTCVSVHTTTLTWTPDQDGKHLPLSVCLPPRPPDRLCHQIRSLPYQTGWPVNSQYLFVSVPQI